MEKISLALFPIESCQGLLKKSLELKKILKRDKKRGKALVKWSGYNNEFNSSIDLNDIENINT